MCYWWIGVINVLPVEAQEVVLWCLVSVSTLGSSHKRTERLGGPQCAFVLLSDYGTCGGQVCWWSVLLPHHQRQSLKSPIVMDKEGGGYRVHTDRKSSLAKQGRIWLFKSQGGVNGQCHDRRKAALCWDHWVNTLLQGWAACMMLIVLSLIDLM